jgi:hypothetical protein
VVRAVPPPRPDLRRCCPHCGALNLILVGLMPRAPP